MISRFRFAFIVFEITAIVIFTVYLRMAENRAFYKLCKIKTQQNRLKQQLTNKHLKLESLINPAALSQRLDSQ